MRRPLLTFLALLVATLPARSGNLELQVDRLTVRDGVARVVLKVLNSSGQAYSYVFAECAFLDGNKKAVDTAKAMFQTVPANGHAYAKAAIDHAGEVKTVDCRIILTG
jgi:hypothetical protein